MSESITTTAQIKIAGITRTTEISYRYDDAHGEPTNAETTDRVLAQIGRGTARYPDRLSLWPVTAERPAPRGAATVTAADGTEWAYGMGTCVRNQQARIVAWESPELRRTNEVNQTRR